MSYGMQIRTVNGLENIENLRSLREVFRYLGTTANGSVVVANGANESNSAVFFEVYDGNAPPRIGWDGNTLKWADWPNFPTSSNFAIIVCRFK